MNGPAPSGLGLETHLRHDRLAARGTEDFPAGQPAGSKLNDNRAKLLTRRAIGELKSLALGNVFMANGGEAISPPRLIGRAARARQKSDLIRRRSRVIRLRPSPGARQHITIIGRAQAAGVLPQIRRCNVSNFSALTACKFRGAP